MAKKKTDSLLPDDDNGGDEEKKNELVLSKSQFPICRPDSQVRQALEANLATGESFAIGALQRIKIPSGGQTTKWLVPTLEGEEQTDEVVGALVYYGLRGVLWPSDDQMKGTLPYLITHDLRTAIKVGDDIGDLDPTVLEAAQTGPATWDWKKLHYNQWGTGKKGIGKRCQEQRLMCILPPGEDNVFPYLVVVSPGSLAKVSNWFIRLPINYWQAMVGLKLTIETSKGGQDYCQINPRLVDRLSMQEGMVLKKLYTDVLGDMLKGIEVEPEE